MNLNKYHNIFLGLCILLLLTHSCEEKNTPENHKMKVCSFNIRFDNPGDGYNRWENRREDVVTFLNIEQPDLIGMQEALLNQLEYIEAELPKYSRVGIGRDDGEEAGEFSPILFKNERFKLNSTGTFWLSETPEKPSIGWDAQIKRICTYAFLTDRKTGHAVHVYNSHFSHVGVTARYRSAQLIVDSIQAKSAGVRVILTGDFNTEPNTTPYSEFIKGGLADSFDSELKLGPVGTYNGFNVTDKYYRRIDYIFTIGFNSVYYITYGIITGNSFLSDHFPVIAQMEYSEI